jgi:hypothetical protein
LHSAHFKDDDFDTVTFPNVSDLGRIEQQILAPRYSIQDAPRSESTPQSKYSRDLSPVPLKGLERFAKVANKVL